MDKPQSETMHSVSNAPLAPEISRRTIVRNIAALLSGTSFGQAATALALFITARALGPEGAGQYVACFALAKMSSVLFESGMDAWLLKEGGIGRKPLGEIVASMLVIKGLFGFLWFPLLWISTLILDPATYPPNLILLIALTTWGESILSTIMSSNKAILRNQANIVLSVLSSGSLLLLTIRLLLTGSSSALPFVGVRLLTASSTAVLGLIWFTRSNRLIPHQRTMRWVLQEARPFFLSQALVTVYSHADITIIAIFLGRSATGIYGPASRLIQAFFLIPRSVFGVMLPALSRFLATHDERLERSMKRMLHAMTFLGGGIWLLIALAGGPLILLFLGEDFAASIELLPILGAVLYFKAGSYGLAAVIVAANRQHQRVIVQAISAAINVVLNLLFIQRLGLYAVAWVYVISEAFLWMGYMIITARWNNTGIPSRMDSPDTGRDSLRDSS